jgi:nitroimidazol reductase NimA-like FMN-containing flavoprotein (pyridoxamine 5'-phosphate oxidase superfamily)
MRRADREITDHSMILQILQSADVCRIAMADDNIPYIVAMNFGLAPHGQALYFHCAHEGKKIHILKKNNTVCFQVDVGHDFFLHEVACGCSMKYRSVVGMGTMHFVTDRIEKIEALQIIMHHYTQKWGHVFKEPMIDKTTILRLDIKKITGKALVKPGHMR